MFDLLATYIHDLDPVIFSVSEKVKLRWYGLAYVMGFMAAYYILLRLARRDLWVVAEDKVSDVVTYTAIFGVFLGGRLGYVFFYMIPSEGWSYIFSDPIKLIAVWEGGMASHGGILGITFYTLFYAWKNKLSWLAVGDGFAIVAPLGVFFGRVANFINGELYGTVTDPDKWYAVKFPKSLFREDYGHLEDAMFSAAVADPEKAGSVIGAYGEPGAVPLWAYEEQLAPIARENPEVLQAIGDHVPARHPSQLYEGILEGLVVFLLLYALRVAFPKLWNGVLSGTFFIVYAIFRIGVETVREPDAERILGVTKVQFYSFFMIAIGVAFLVYACRSRKSLKSA